MTGGWRVDDVVAGASPKHSHACYVSLRPAFCTPVVRWVKTPGFSTRTVHRRPRGSIVISVLAVWIGGYVLRRTIILLIQLRV